MSRRRSVRIRPALRVALGMVLAVALVARAEDAQEPPPESAESTPDAPEPTPEPDSEVAAAPAGNIALLYKLPVGKPRARIGGGRRGAQNPLPLLVALVPNHVGLTTAPQPSLYWNVSGPAPEGMYFAFAITDEESIEPLVELRLDSPASAGIQEILLAAGDARLEPGVEYRWSVTLVVDPAGPSTRDPVAGGWIERVPPPPDLEARLRAAGPDGAPAIYADEGLWYDALAPLASRAIRDPDDAIARLHLGGLLRQVDLDGVAADVAQPVSPRDRD